jgi:hypothetical protein
MSRNTLCGPLTSRASPAMRRAALTPRPNLWTRGGSPGAAGTGGAPRTRPWAEDRLQRAHDASIFNRSLVAASSRCGCFYCLSIFPATAVTSWCDPRPMPDLTALCPRCGIDGVLPDASGFEPTLPFLEAMQARWCSWAMGKVRPS